MICRPLAWTIAVVPTATTTKTAAATAAERRRPLCRSVPIVAWQEERQHYEGEYPGEVEIEPMRQDELGADEDRTSQRRQLERPAVPWTERRHDGERHHRRLQRRPQPAQVRDARRVVLP